MKRTITGFVVAGVFFALCLVGTISRSVAEPIPGTDAAAAADNSPQAQAVAAAAARFKERDVEGALKLLKEAAKKDPDLAPPQIVMAEFFSQVKYLAGLRNALEQATLEDPNDPEAYVLMGDFAMNDRRFTEAELLYQKANGLMAKFDKSKKRKDQLEPRILGGLATAMQSRKNWAGAQKQLEAWVKVDPASIPATYQLALCLFKQKNPEGALEKLNAAAALDPKKMLTPEATLAQFYEQDGDRENAKKWMAAALTKAPKDLQTRLVAGQWALETGQLKDAEKQADAALQIDPDNQSAKNLRGIVAIFQKDYAKAEHYFKLALLQSPNDFTAKNNLALALIESKDEAKRKLALDYAEGNLNQYPTHRGEAASTYGIVLFRMGRQDEAAKAFETAMNSGGLSPDTAYYIAKLSDAQKRPEQAIQWLENALKSNQPFVMRQEAQALLDQLKK
jgi:tetratricopeptide (TPR) repeat protein